MADDNETGSVPNAGRPKRQPPTLELAATSVTDRLKAGEEPATPGPDAPPADAPQPDTSPSDMPPHVETETAAEEPAASSREKSALLLPIAAGAVAGAVVAGVAW